jgi:replicative DNA helicase
MTDHSELVLGGILSASNPRRDLLAQAIVQLTGDHFVQDIQKNIFALLVRYYDRTGDVMPERIFTKALEDNQIETAKVIAYSETFKALEALSVSQSEFKWGLSALKEDLAKRLTGLAIAESMEILERGYEVGKDFLKGHDDARKYLSSKVAEIERKGNAESSPEGNILLESDAILQDYVTRRDTDVARGIHTGVRSIDQATGGLQRGELVMVCAYAGQGKSMLSTQAAWSAAFEQGKNVFFATSETVRSQVTRRLLARHSRLSMFGKPEGINSADLKRGTLTAADEKILKDVLDDWRNNPEYGKLDVVQVPRGATLTYVETRLREFGRQHGCDLCIVDYLALLKPESKRGNEREEFNEILRDAKGMATSFNDGEGVPLVSPWQMSREAFKQAVRDRQYSLASLADTAEAERSADVIMALIRDEENMNEMRLQFLKTRDDQLPVIREVEIDFRSTYIGDRRTATSFVQGGASEDRTADIMEFL